MAITVGNTSSNFNATNLSSYTVSHNSNSTYLVAIFTGNATVETARTITADYNGVSMTELATINTTTTSRNWLVYIFGLENPATGTNTIKFTASAGLSGFVGGGISLIGVDTTTQLGVTGTNNAGCNVSLTPNRADSVLVSASSVASAATPPVLTAKSGQTEIFNREAAAANTENVGGAWYRILTATGTYSVGSTTTSTSGDIAAAVEIYAEPTGYIFTPIDFR